MTSIVNLFDSTKTKLIHSKMKWGLRLEFNRGWRLFGTYLILILPILGIFFILYSYFLNFITREDNGVISATIGDVATWSSLSESFVTSSIEILLSLLITIILSTFIIALRGCLQALSSSRRILSSKVKFTLRVVGYVLLFLVFPPFVVNFYYPNISLYNKVFWLNYSAELAISLLVIMPFLVFWWFIIKVRSPNLNDTLAAWDDEAVEEDDVQFLEQKYSLYKWLDIEEITGYYELREHKYSNGLHEEVLKLMKNELSLIEINENNADVAESLMFLLDEQRA